MNLGPQLGRHRSPRLRLALERIDRNLPQVFGVGPMPILMMRCMVSLGQAKVGTTALLTRDRTSVSSRFEMTVIVPAL
jgi:hypothetical protein